MVSQSQSIVLRQSQNLVMSPQMQQSLKILQLSTLDLGQLIDSELQKNPLLEKGDELVEYNDLSSELDSSEGAGSDGSDYDNTDSFEQANSSNLNSDRNVLDADFDESWSSNSQYDSEKYSPSSKMGDSSSAGSSSISSSSQGSNSSSSEDYSDAGSIIEQTYTRETTLKEHLLEQVNLEFEDAAQKIIAAHIVDMVDKSGYLSQDRVDQDRDKIKELLGCNDDDINDVLVKVKQFDPTGVCCTDLGECLALQLKERDRLDPAMESLLKNLDLLAKGELPKLRRICSVDEDDLRDMIMEIKSLNPRPASNFLEEETQTKYPDLILVQKNGQWMVDLNMEMLPKVNINRDFYYKMKSAAQRKEDKKFLSENLASANFLMQAISRRTETVLKVAIEIVKEQQDFFDKGINYLKPISMKNIAEKVDLHESTIGRVVSNKYITTPRGVFELKYFFSNALSSTYGDEEFSTETVKHHIKEIIESEDKILSDDKISQMVKEKGINVARRTVAKYREAMGIPTSAERKRLKKIKI